MLFGNVFSGLTQVAKSVLGLFEKDEHQPISYFEHDKPLVVAPTVEPLNAVPEEVWKIYPTKCGRLLEVSNFGGARLEPLERSNWQIAKDGWFYPNRNALPGGVRIGVLSKEGLEKQVVNITLAVLELFVAPRPKYITANTPRKVIFKDGDHNNIRSENLRWATERECKITLENKIEDDLYWMPIPSYEGYYEISNFGTVRSLDRTITNTKGKKQNFKGKHLKRVSTEDGLCYSLSKNGKAETFNVARLTVAVFMADKINFGRKFIVKHKDGHNGNCQLSNLEVEYLN